MHAIAGDSSVGVYEFVLAREWVARASPVLSRIAKVVSVVLPVARAVGEVVVDEKMWSVIEAEAGSAVELLSVVSDGLGSASDSSFDDEPERLTRGGVGGAVLRSVHSML